MRSGGLVVTQTPLGFETVSRNPPGVPDDVVRDTVTIDTNEPVNAHTPPVLTHSNRSHAA